MREVLGGAVARKFGQDGLVLRHRADPPGGILEEDGVGVVLHVTPRPRRPVAAVADRHELVRREAGDALPLEHRVGVALLRPREARAGEDDVTDARAVQLGVFSVLRALHRRDAGRNVGIRHHVHRLRSLVVGDETRVERVRRDTGDAVVGGVGDDEVGDLRRVLAVDEVEGGVDRHAALVRGEHLQGGGEGQGVSGWRGRVMGRGRRRRGGAREEGERGPPASRGSSTSLASASPPPSPPPSPRAAGSRRCTPSSGRRRGRGRRTAARRPSSRRRRGRATPTPAAACTCW